MATAEPASRSSCFDPTNEYDANAVQVLYESRVVGYLSRGNAEGYQPILNEVIKLGYEPHVAGEIERTSVYIDNDGKEVLWYGAFLYVAYCSELATWITSLPRFSV
jgi:hypothetical protein